MSERDEALRHAYRLFYGDLDLCGCGTPEDTFTFIFRLLISTPRPGGLDAFRSDRYRWMGESVFQHGAVHLALSVLNGVDVMEHGGAIGGSWLTPKGVYYRTALCDLTWDEVSDAGFPHSGDECVDACWTLSEAQLKRSPGPIKPDTGYVYEPIGQPAGTGLTQEMLDRAFDSMIRPPYSRLEPATSIPDTIPAEWLRRPDDGRPQADRLPRGRNPFIGCREIDGTWIHGRPHSCPRPARGF